MMPIKTVAALIDEGLAAPETKGALEQVTARYALSITSAMAALMRRDDPCDPIARQFVPTAPELETAPEDRRDPIGDAAHAPIPGIVHRHKDRALFMPILTCPVFCRFCFRRESVGKGENALSPAALDAAFAYLEAHAEIWEVILTGGDPFSLNARRIGEIARRLSAIPHVKIIRWHTRVPVVDPARITDEFVAALIVPGATTIIALHANHPREFSPDARAAIARLIDAGLPMVSQSVLLKGVNADVETLETLMRTLVENRIKPYYLHHPDLAPGTAHFRLSVAEGQDLVRSLRARVSGLCMPTYVLDIPGGFAKVPLNAGDVEKTETGWRLRDQQGNWHAYP
jgi:lysine 2,3-aminomutase